MKFMLITNDPEIAHFSESCGVDRIFVDMEWLGKEARQGHLDTHKAAHTLEDVRRVRPSIQTAELMVRTNPLHPGTRAEVDGVIEAGADRIMLPMFRRTANVRSFLKIIDGRVPVTLLAETPASLAGIAEWVELLGPDDQVHFGLNDLSIGMGLDFLFEPLAARMLDHPAFLLRARGVEFGIGGVARAGHGKLCSECVLGEYVRLGSSWAILSRAMHGQARDLAELQANLDLKYEIDLLHQVVADWQVASEEEIEANHERLRGVVVSIANHVDGERD